MDTPEYKRTLSCGVLIQSPKGWLLAHATKTPRWDLPKGRAEAGESALEAAVRETHEEIGIDLTPWKDQMVDRGQHVYLPKKDLHLFTLYVDEPFDLSGCCCSTNIERNGVSIPETDAYAWVKPRDAISMVGKSLVRYLEALELIDFELPENLRQFKPYRQR
jgi:8-oxo-dGTP pyrophosphatase MutT (NUDIX family)